MKKLWWVFGFLLSGAYIYKYGLSLKHNNNYLLALKFLLHKFIVQMYISLIFYGNCMDEFYLMTI